MPNAVMHFGSRTWWGHGTNRKQYPTDVGDDEWAIVAPCLTLMKEDAPQRERVLRKVFNDARCIFRTHAPETDDAQRPAAVAHPLKQTHRWIKDYVFEAVVNDEPTLL